MQQLTNTREMIIWVPTNWTVRLMPGIHRGKYTPEARNVATGCKEEKRKASEKQDYISSAV